MNAFNSAMTSLFDVLLKPFELLGPYGPLILLSGAFGVFGLFVFKHISWQDGIKMVKDKIKGHLIEIRIYQDDLVVVTRSIGKILGRNLQYIALNFGPFIPLMIPFGVLASQFVVRYAFAPLPVEEVREDFLPGQGTVVTIEMAAGHEADVESLQIEFPEGLVPVGPLHRAPSQGRAYQEILATASGAHELVLTAGGARETKLIYAGDEDPRVIQPERRSASDWFNAFLWPGEQSFDSDSPFHRVVFAYPDRPIAWLPDGALGVILSILIFSMLFGFVMLKPLGVQI